MKQMFLYTLLFLLFILGNTIAQPYLLSVTNGEVTIVRNGSGTRDVVATSGMVHLEDSIIATEKEYRITILLNTDIRILAEGPFRFTFAQRADTLGVYLDEGHIFLDHPVSSDKVSIFFKSDGYYFIPLETAMAVKKTGYSFPSVSVLRGAVKMITPDGTSKDIASGHYGKATSGGTIGSGEMDYIMISELEKWSGVKFETWISDKQQNKATREDEVGVRGTASQEGETRNDEKATITMQDNDSTSSEQDKPSAKSEKNSGVGWEISAGGVTVDNEQWTRLAVGVDVPVWKFGVFFDVEVFIDNEGSVSNKGWDFKNNRVEALTRKIRYIRYGYEEDPMFAKIGGLNDVTLGYGFLVDRFTNMLSYPDEKLLGCQFYINDLGPYGITVQSVIADFIELKDDGGMGAVRLAVRPLEKTELPIIEGITIGGTYAADRNQYAPARKWKFHLTDEEEIIRYLDELGIITDSLKRQLMNEGIDVERVEQRMKKIREERAIQDKTGPFGLAGGDISVPLIRTSLLRLDLYGQTGLRTDFTHGWGVGVPGLALEVWKLSAAIEYRHVRGRFMPGYFGTYYLEERLNRYPAISTKEDRLQSDTLNGIFGTMGVNFGGALVVDNSYQYMTGEYGTDQRLESTVSLGEIALSRIPRMNKAEMYYAKARIGEDVVAYDNNGTPEINTRGEYRNDRFFEKTPFMYYGYRFGIDIAEGATLAIDSRYGFSRNAIGILEHNNNIKIQTLVTF